MLAGTEVDPMTEFFDAIKSPVTKVKYEKRLDLFLRQVGIEGSTVGARAREFVSRAKADNQWASLTINAYMRLQKERAERGEIAEATVPNFFKPIKLFCEMNDILLNWKKITRRIPRGRGCSQDRLPRIEEITKILAYPDRRVKPAVLLMLSSGIRVGAFDYLNWGNIERVEGIGGKPLAARVRVYAGTKDEYSTFASPECYKALEDYMEFRKSQGERVTGESPVLRDLFHPDKLGRGEPHLPKRLKSTGVKRMMEDALKGTGLRGKLEVGKRRHEFQVDHGFRKFFKSASEKSMKSLHVEILMGHNVGLAENYYRPSEKEMLEDYLRAVPSLTIMERGSLAPIETREFDDLKMQIATLEMRVKDTESNLRSTQATLKGVNNTFSTYLKAWGNARKVFGDKKLDQLLVAALEEQERRLSAR